MTNLTFFQDNQYDMLKTVIDTRRKDDIIHVLERAKSIRTSKSRYLTLQHFRLLWKGNEQKWHGLWQENGRVVPGMNTYKTSTNREYADDCLFQKSILITTLSNDPDTLKVILNWGRTNQMKHESPTQIDENPILLASLEGYTKCMKKLYEAGFRIHLLEEDWRGVKDQTKKNRLKFLSL